MRRAMAMAGVAIGLILVTQIGVLAGYIDNGNGTVTDTSTGLMWQKETPVRTMTWEEALFYCENLTLGDYTDWRLPTFKELRSLVDYSRYTPAINTTFFPDTVASFYWSSTSYAYSPDFAWSVFFYDGFDSRYEKYYSFYVRAVRGGQGGGGICQAQQVLESAADDKAEKKLAVLREFRDKVLAGTPDGQEMIRLYYLHDAEIRTILAADADLTENCLKVMGRAWPVVYSALKAKTEIRIPGSLLNDVLGLLDRVAASGSALLRNDLDRVKAFLISNVRSR
ncbi:MAG: DUF1566 domain-containing protein [Thermodesulfobacteriota bacterium]